MKTLLKKLFAITLFLFVVLGIATVLVQAIAIITLQTELSIWISGTIRKYAIATSGVCALVAFAYLMFGGEKPSSAEEDD